jgi:hypothetical protein
MNNHGISGQLCLHVFLETGYVNGVFTFAYTHTYRYKVKGEG